MFVSPGKVHGSRQDHDMNVTQTFSALQRLIFCFKAYGGICVVELTRVIAGLFV